MQKDLHKLRISGKQTIGSVDKFYAGNINSDVRVYFRDHAARLANLIEEADVVVGCVAWLSDLKVLAALRNCQTRILVQKEDFLRDSHQEEAWNEWIRDAYAELTPLKYRSDHQDAVRCVGMVRDPARTRGVMHHKFFVFCNQDYSPYAVWTGSYNPSYFSKNSLENSVVIYNENLAYMYQLEFELIEQISEPLNWESPYAKGDLRE